MSLSAIGECIGSGHLLLGGNSWDLGISTQWKKFIITPLKACGKKQRCCKNENLKQPIESMWELTNFNHFRR